MIDKRGQGGGGGGGLGLLGLIPLVTRFRGGWVVALLIVGFVVYGALKITVGLRLSQEEEFEGADRSIHRIGATPEHEVNW